MKNYVFLVIGLALFPTALSSQGKPVIVTQVFTVASGVELPYDMSQMRAQLVAEFKVTLGKEFEIVAEAPTTPNGTVYTLDAEITGWRPGNAAKRLLVDLPSKETSHPKCGSGHRQDWVDPVSFLA